MQRRRKAGPLRASTSERGGQRRVRMRRHVVVVGGGLAGAAAATVLAERGVGVTWLERETFLGGRVGAWSDRLHDGTPFQMERGFHAFFRQYYNVRALMRRVDPSLQMLKPLHDYPLLGPNGASESFAGLPRKAPWNVTELVRRTPTLGLRELANVNVREALAMLRFDPDATYAGHDTRSAREYLDGLRFPPEARRMLFDVFSHSFFNPEDDYSAAELLMNFHFYFMGNREGLIFDVLREPFSVSFWQPLQRYLESLGVDVRLGADVQYVEPRDSKFFVHGSHGLARADALVLALDVPGLQRVMEASPRLGPPHWRRDIADLRVTRPFVVWRLWLDRPCDPQRAPFAGTAGMGLLDNISVFDRFEGESRRWAERSGGSIVELHAYAVPPDTEETRLRCELLESLHALYPETRAARIVDERFLWRQDCPAFPPGGYARRPEVSTPVDGLMLAGDFVRMSLPCALMERAVASGMHAANRLLARWATEEEPLGSVPPRGLLA